MPFDLIRVTRYALKITEMRYLSGTVAIIPGNLRASWWNHATCHALLDCTKVKISRHKQCKTGEIQPFTCKMAKQAFVGL